MTIPFDAICDADFEAPNPQNPEFSLHEEEWFGLRLRKNLKRRSYQVYRGVRDQANVKGLGIFLINVIYEGNLPGALVVVGAREPFCLHEWPVFHPQCPTMRRLVATH
jgi:hypothetical protein